MLKDNVDELKTCLDDQSLYDQVTRLHVLDCIGLSPDPYSDVGDGKSDFFDEAEVSEFVQILSCLKKQVPGVLLEVLAEQAIGMFSTYVVVESDMQHAELLSIASDLLTLELNPNASCCGPLREFSAACPGGVGLHSSM